MSLQPYKRSMETTPYEESFYNPWSIYDPLNESVFFPSRNRQQLRFGTNEASRPLAPILTADLIESENNYSIHADLPGVEDLDISISDRYLTIKGQRKLIKESDNEFAHSVERSYGRVQRSILLPLDADSDHADAKFRNGVLTVTFPKLVASGQVRKLTIT